MGCPGISWPTKLAPLIFYEGEAVVLSLVPWTGVARMLGVGLNRPFVNDMSSHLG